MDVKLDGSSGPRPLVCKDCVIVPLGVVTLMASGLSSVPHSIR